MAGIIILDILIMAVIVPWNALFNWLTKGAMLATKLTPDLEVTAIDFNWASISILAGIIFMAVALMTLLLSRES